MDIEIIKKALKEDLDEIGDVTSSAIFDEQISTYTLIAKDNGILAGKNYFTEVFKQVDKDTEVHFYFKDGDKIKNEEKIVTIKGKSKSILTAERVAINFLSHLSGIATITAKFVAKLKGNTKILDTRKTIPGLREAEKYAVRCGGGDNHRMGLFDMVMIKDNHIDGAGGIKRAVGKVRNRWGNKYKIEVETRNIREVEEALAAGADFIMLDNMDPGVMNRAIKLISGKTKVEASGNMNLERISKISELGVDYISVGLLTHTISAFDFSLIKSNKK